MLQAIVTVLAVIDPVVCGSIFLTLTPKLTLAQRRRDAIKASFSILVILMASALIGLKVLSIFGISLDVFRVVGGMIIAYMGFDMLRGSHAVTRPPSRTATRSLKAHLRRSLCLQPARGRSRLS
jgi:multiple antibiotic resistance protein